MPSEVFESWGTALPLEIITQIIASRSNTFRHFYGFKQRQADLTSFCRVSRLWYAATLEVLYARPLIVGGNFNGFVATICPSLNARIPTSYHARLVKCLDLHRVDNGGCQSLIAPVLGRIESHLEVFVAPQAIFGSVVISSISGHLNSHADQLHASAM